MKIDSQYIKHLANLSRLKFNETEENDLILSLNEMLEMVDKLDEVNVDGIQAIKYISTDTVSVRSDEIYPHSQIQESFKNAPKHNNQYFLVPKVIQN